MTAHEYALDVLSSSKVRSRLHKVTTHTLKIQKKANLPCQSLPTYDLHGGFTVCASKHGVVRRPFP